MLLAFNEVEVNFSEVKWQGICFPCRLMSDLGSAVIFSNCYLGHYWDLAKPFGLSNEDPPTAQRNPSFNGRASLAAFPVFHLLH